MDLLQIWYNDRYCCILHFGTSLIVFDLDSRSQECEKVKKNSAPIISQFSIDLNGIWFTVEV